MKMRADICTLFFVSFMFTDCSAGRKPIPYKEQKTGAKHDNPNFIRDRNKELLLKKLVPIGTSVMHPEYHPAWMDYCDPYHCNDYHKLACGLNRLELKFKWFQSGCHIIINNLCATYRGSMKYDMIDPKFCHMYVMNLREGCTQNCDDEEIDPVCGISSLDNHVVLFANKCALNAANCRNETIDEYEPVNMKICSYYVNLK